MILKQVPHLLVASVLAWSATSFAADVKLSCPAGTVERTRSSPNGAAYCVKTNQKVREPVLHGAYVDYWANGQKQSEGQYQDGFRTGRWTFWDANGVKTGETEFVAGDYHGTRVQYFANGKPKMIEEYRKGLRSGSVQELNENGQLVRQSQFHDGHEVASR
ncbi:MULTISPECIES: toxin-antitoxin system YwqK family antitoxin [unclassified Corallococcus]|uniref:toxin-antitoxin system YwqK family antitoxin n=1 Tax=unclassified Corallococcus TaxID=2685029 RepID=UPI001A8DA332|nr:MULTISPECIES: hypothetical protein [unclassified Corallococcus]MBN9686694.1 hypothetical protein [Corallococcus sp. NCSPR001]WAS81887.1 hypothetical protein O0N60_21395 [Corallococcus sp. NCRR]